MRTAKGVRCRHPGWGCASLRSSLVLATGLLAGCALPGAANPGGVGAASRAAADAQGRVVEEPETLKTPPPESGAPLPAFPPVQRRELANGLVLSHVQQGQLPLSRVVLSFGSGRAQEGDKIGVARLTARLMKVGGAGSSNGHQMLERFESFGTTLHVTTSPDTTTFALNVMNADLAATFSALEAIVSSPRMPLAEFLRLKQAESERAAARARGDLDWGNQVVLFRELFEVPAGVHPYAHFDAKSSDIDRLELSDCNAWRAQHLTPGNAELIVVSSLDAPAVFQQAEQAFSSWPAGAAPVRPSFNRPAGPARLQIFLVDHDESPLSEVTAGVLGAPRSSAAWPALALTTYLLGAGPASRLYRTLREEHQWAVKTSATLTPLVAAPAVVELDATTRRETTGDVVKAMLEQIESLGKEAPRSEEVEHAARALTSAFLNDPKPLEALADRLAVARRLGLEPDYYDSYHQAVLELDAGSLHRIVHPYFELNQTAVVVSGDADGLDTTLAKLAPVVVLDPDNGFSIKRKLPFSPLGSP